MSDIRPFRVEIPQRQLDDLRLRLSLTRYPEKEAVDDWSQGVPLAYLQELAQYWQSHYDLHRLEQRLNAHPQFIATIDGLDIHFLHIKSPEANARPLILTHGWPGSVVEFLKVIPLLTDPVNHGGIADDAFDVICPSLPGYGFSQKPQVSGWGADKIAQAWAQLMAELGYDRYFAQGGDWGAAITTRVAQEDKNCRAIHLNMATVTPTPEQMTDLSAGERQTLNALKHYQQWDSGYSKEQATRPQTIGYSLVDSPVGLLAWIVEKYWAWTDCDGHPENALGKDEMLDNVMVYWINAAGASAARLYWESFGDFITGSVATATGFSIFPKEIFRGSKRWCAGTYENINYWNEVERGGHFAAFEQPELFVDELRRCFQHAAL